MARKKKVEQGTIIKQQSDSQIALSKMPKEHQIEVKRIYNEFNIENTQDIIQYGVNAQTEISNFTNSILSTVRAKDSESIGETLTDLMVKVQDVDVNKLNGEGNLLAKLPFVGQLFTNSKKFIAKYEKIGTQVDKISTELDSAKIHLFKDISLLDKLYKKNEEYLHQIDMYIAAGVMKLEEMKNIILPKLKQEAETKATPEAAQKYSDVQNMVNSFERKIHDLKLTRVIATQMIPQIRMVQASDQALAEKIHGATLHTIPLWKSQLVLSITGLKQKKALELYRNITNTTNELLTKNSEILKENASGIAKEVERGIVDIETLKKSHTNLLTTFQDMVKIQEEGRRARVSAEIELQKLETDLKEKLTQVNTPIISTLDK